MIHLITGGERSGKSRYAQQLALQLSDSPIYLATARHWDADFERRIERHQQERDSRWQSVEEEKHISTVPVTGRAVVLDCVTLWLTNFYADFRGDVQACLSAAQQEMDAWLVQPAEYIIITNELGMGVHATTESGRKFVELQGWMNQYMAQKAHAVTLMVSGIPVKIK